MIIRAGLRELARLIGCDVRQVEDAVREEASARAALSRRGFFQAAGAIAAGSCFSFGAPIQSVSLTDYERLMNEVIKIARKQFEKILDQKPYERFDIRVNLKGREIVTMYEIHYDLYGPEDPDFEST